MCEVKKIQYVQTFENPETRYVHYSDDEVCTDHIARLRASCVVSGCCVPSACVPACIFIQPAMAMLS
jgi:hypothetical protein